MMNTKQINFSGRIITFTVRKVDAWGNKILSEVKALAKIFTRKSRGQYDNRVNIFDLLDEIHCEIKDFHLIDHCRNVGVLAYRIALEMGLSQEEATILYLAGYFHDVGKYTKPDELILSPKKLSDVGYDVIKIHARTSAEFVKAFPWANKKIMFRGVETTLAQIIEDHHERIDGRGYKRKTGKDISMASSILAAADTFEALSTHVRKFNKKPRDLKTIMDIIVGESNKQFPSECVTALQNFIDRIGAVSPRDVIYYQDELKLDESFLKSMGMAKAEVEVDHVFEFFRRMIHKKRGFVCDVDGVTYRIEEIVQDYIISQDGEPAIQRIYQVTPEGEALVAELIQEKGQERKFGKNIFSPPELIEILGLTTNSARNDLRKARSFLHPVGQQYKFIALHHTEAQFLKLLVEYGAVHEYDFADLDKSLAAQNMTTDDVITELKQKGIIADDGTIVTLPQTPDELNFDNGIKKGVFDTLQDKYVNDVYKKRERFLKLWRETKAETVSVKQNLLEQKFAEERIFPLLDYLPRIGLRGVPLNKLEEIMLLVGAEFKLPFKQIEFLTNTLILHYVFSNVFFLDAKHFVETPEEAEANIMILMNKALDFKKRYPSFTPYVDKLVQFYLYDLKDVKDILEPVSDELFIISTVDRFMRRNGNLQPIIDDIPRCMEDEKIKLLQAFRNALNLIYPDDLSILSANR